MRSSGPFLLDVNVLIALAWPGHEGSERVGPWFERHSHSGWATCPFTQSGFVRVSSNPSFSPNALTPAAALAVLEKNLKLPGHQFWPASISLHEALKNIERRLTRHRQITDAYLLGLAIHRGGKLATLDAKLASIGPRGTVEFIE